VNLSVLRRTDITFLKILHISVHAFFLIRRFQINGGTLHFIFLAL